MKVCFLGQTWAKSQRQIHEIMQNRFINGIFYSSFFCDFLPKSVKTWFLGGRVYNRHQI